MYVSSHVNTLYTDSKFLTPKEVVNHGISTLSVVEKALAADEDDRKMPAQKYSNIGKLAISTHNVYLIDVSNDRLTHIIYLFYTINRF